MPIHDFARTSMKLQGFSGLRPGPHSGHEGGAADGPQRHGACGALRGGGGGGRRAYYGKVVFLDIGFYCHLKFRRALVFLIDLQHDDSSYGECHLEVSVKDFCLDFRFFLDLDLASVPSSPSFTLNEGEAPTANPSRMTVRVDFIHDMQQESGQAFLH